MTLAMPRVKAALAETSARTVVVMLGEVDTGFVIWYRAARSGASVDDMLARALANYERFLTEIAARFNVICISTPLPTIQDGAVGGEVATCVKSSRHRCRSARR